MTTSQKVSVLKKCLQKAEDWLFLNRHPFVLVAATRWRNQFLKLITAGTDFNPLAMLPPPWGIIRLLLCLLGLQVLKGSIRSLSLPTPRALIRASPLMGRPLCLSGSLFLARLCSCLMPPSAANPPILPRTDGPHALASL